MSLDDIDVVRRPVIVEQPHILGPGTDFFTEDGRPVRPQPSAHTIHKVFSGSALDLNAMGNKDGEDEDEEAAAVPVAQGSASRPGGDATMSSIFHQVSSDSDRERTKATKNKTTVLVVGGNGYIASHVVANLLSDGYTVRITVAEALESAEQLELYSLVPDAGHRLSITEADITNASAFRDVIRGCKYVVHCGVSPSHSLREKNVVQVHVDSVQALFDAIRLSGKPTLKRVILTGSAAAVFHIQDPVPPRGRFDESSWNLRATAQSDPVPFAKISFEREAWRLQKMFGVELVVILPSIVIGPSLLHETSEAMRTIHDLASGSPYAPNLFWNFVDVRDVAKAHVRAMENADLVDQRIIVSNACLSLCEIGQLIKKAFPHLNPPIKAAPLWITLIVAPLTHARVKLSFLWRNLGVKKVLDSSKSIRELGLELTPMERTVADSVDQLIRAGHLPAKPTQEQQQVLDAARARRAFIRNTVFLSVTAGVVVLAALKMRSKN